MASELTGKSHLIRSVIIELHLSVEIEMRRFLYFFLRGMILYKDKGELKSKAEKLVKRVDSFMFGQMWRLMEVAIKDGPWSDLENISEINKTRNQVAHGDPIEQIRYRERNPFTDADCLANMYFDVWAITQIFPKFFHKILEEPIINLQYYRAGFEAYRKKYGALEFPHKYNSPFSE